MRRRAFIKTGLIFAPAIVRAQEIFPPAFWTPAPAAGGGGGSPTPELLWYKFTEGSGTTVADSSGNSNTGNFGTGATWVTGASGSGSAIKGDASHRALVSSSNVSYGTNKISVCFWMKIANYPASVNAHAINTINTAGLGSIVGCEVYLDVSGNVFMRLSGGFTQCYRYKAVSTGAWHHYVGALDNSGTNGAITLYFDGSSTAGDGNFFDATGTANFNANLLSIAGITGDANPADVSIDDLRIYNRLISSSEVTQIYNDPK